MDNPDIVNIRKTKKLKRTQFWRRKRGLLKAGAELHKRCEAEVYILVRRHGRSYIFSSERGTSSPFSERTLVRHIILWGTCLTSNRNRVTRPLNGPSPTTFRMMIPRRERVVMVWSSERGKVVDHVL